MTKNIYRKSILFTILTLLLFGFTSVGKIEAADIQSTNDFLTVAPPKVELWTEQGKEIGQTLRITNESDASALIALSLESFSVTDPDGSIVLGRNFSLPNDIGSWITFDQKDATLAPKETKFIKYKINTPLNALPGGNYAAIVISMDRLDRPQNENTAIARVVSLILLSVAGDIRDNAALEKYTHNTSSKNGKTIQNFTLRLKNNGNNHIRPSGSIIITNLLGQKVAEVPLNSEAVLPNVYRTMITSWKPDKLLFGRYNANLIATYGINGNKKIAEVIPFYVFPGVLTAISAILLLFIVFMVVMMFRTRKRSAHKSARYNP